MMKSFKRPVTYFLNSIFQKCYLTHRGCCCQAIALGVSKGRIALPEGDITLLQLKNTSRALCVKHHTNISLLKLLKSKGFVLLPV